ncbi:MAG: ankyrin repeat domain-containing protein, partial [Bacteroidota bacterium]
MWKKNKYQQDHNLKPVVFELIKAHRNEEAKQHLRNNPREVHLKGWMSDTPLHIAARCGNMEMVHFLIEEGAAVNAARTNVFQTPLCWADNREIAAYLLDHGAEMKDRELDMATRKDRVQVIDLLLERGATIRQHDPEYLQCNSREAIQVYLDHGINIHGADSFGSTILHKLAWLNLPDVLDMALQHGVPWKKDSSYRSPYMLAKQGQRHEMVSHIRTRYPNLISNQITPLETDLPYERLIFIRKHPGKPLTYHGLTQSGKLIEYGIHDDGEIEVYKAIEIDLPLIRNFTYDGEGNMLIPTGEHHILKLNADTFERLDDIRFQPKDTFDQITYLPKKEIYIGSSNNWKITTFDKHLNLLYREEAEDGTFFPLVRDDESLFAFWSYDQDTYFNLYHLDASGKPEFLDTFWAEEKGPSQSFCFVGDLMVVAYAGVLELITFEAGQVQILDSYKIAKRNITG